MKGVIETEQVSLMRWGNFLAIGTFIKSHPVKIVKFPILTDSHGS